MNSVGSEQIFAQSPKFSKNPFSCNLFAWKNWCGAHLITRVEPKKRGVGAERPSPPRGSVVWTRGRVYAWTRGLVNRLNRPFFFFFFFLDNSRKLSKIVSVLQFASVERFDVSRMRDFCSDIFRVTFLSVIFQVTFFE